MIDTLDMSALKLDVAVRVPSFGTNYVHVANAFAFGSQPNFRQSQTAETQDGESG